MICYFIDHSSGHAKEQYLAELSLLHKVSKILNSNNSIALITCHRIEYYINESDDNKDLENLFKNFKKISNPSEAYLRLFKIALGLESKIIGENSIYKQTSQSVQEYLYNNPHEKICMNILLNAKQTRDKFQFWSKNHGQLIYNHIKNGEAKTIIFFGAGLLNQTIINSTDLNSYYEKIILVTRNVKRAKQCIATTDSFIDIIGIDNINEKTLLVPYDIFIATDRLNDANKKKIAHLCSKKDCSNVVDVSSSPIAEIEDVAQNYFSMYSKNTDDFVRENNQQIKQKKEELLKFLNSKSNDWYLNHNKQ